MLVLVVIIGYYAWLFIDSGSVDKQIAETNTKLNTERQNALAEKNRSELMVRQQQLKTLSGLVGSHIYWSQLFQPLADSTLKLASYKSLKANLNGELNLDVTVPTLEDLDKYMQIFNLPEFNQNFSNISIGGFTQTKGKDSTSVQFQVKMKYDPKLIKYKDPNANAG